MNNKVVIISHNQCDTLLDMVNTIDKGLDYTVVLDRCTDNSELTCLCYHIPYIKTDITCEGFYAGYARNIGSRNFEGNILFLDGDRVPQFKVTNDFIKHYADMWGITILRDVSLCDVRKYISRGEYELKYPQAHHNNLTSCGLILSKDFIAQARISNGGDIFNSIFDGFWGCEDTQLGDLAFAYNFKVGFASENYRVSGLDVLTSIKNYNTPQYALQFAKKKYTTEKAYT